MQKKLCPLNPSGRNVHPELTSFFSYCFYKAAFRLRCDIDESTQSLGIIAPQRGILHLLKKIGPVTQQKLGNELGIDKATMVKFVVALEKKKYVRCTKNKQDRRSKHLQITEKGIEILDQIDRIYSQVEAQYLAHLTKDEQLELKKIIPKLLHPFN